MHATMYALTVSWRSDPCRSEGAVRPSGTTAEWEEKAGPRKERRVHSVLFLTRDADCGTEGEKRMVLPLFAEDYEESSRTGCLLVILLATLTLPARNTILQAVKSSGLAVRNRDSGVRVRACVETGSLCWRRPAEAFLRSCVMTCK
jgi:hypothetical protein